ncbi:MAG TPA: ergothioneine biosynthesis protein EgtC [Acidimicrobiales bacterium]|nr:ergothioneine biosynthesis protein EgtC [Acidimicrobiales bacterium]
MCRLFAYLGPSVPLDRLLLTSERSFMRQAWAPQHQRKGVVNVDGFGVGWYDFDVRPEPVRYRRAVPIWADRNFFSLAGVVRSGAVLAALRAASTFLPVEESSTAPFTAGPWLFAHNGEVTGFRDGTAAALRRRISDERLTAVEGTSDSELLFALALDRLTTGMPPGEALADVVRTVDELAGGRLNMLLTDGRQLAGIAAGDTLFVRQGEDGVRIASEPADDVDDWEQVPDRTLLVGDVSGLGRHAL